MQEACGPGGNTGGYVVATRSRARHFHATAKALNSAAATRGDVDGMLLSAEVSDVDIQSIIAGAGAEGALISDAPAEVPAAAVELPASSMPADDLVALHEELRWAESKLMQASERLAEAQEARRKDLVALAIMRRELLGSFAAERAWLHGSMRYFGDVLPVLVEREEHLANLVDNGVRTGQVISELAQFRAERKIFELASAQVTAQLARIDDNESSSEYQVATEAYEREPDGASMRELARLRALSTRQRREAVRLRTEAGSLIGELGFVSGMGEITAANAFLAAEYEGDERSAERMNRVRGAQYERELERLPEPEAAFKAAFKHPVYYMRARRTTR
ncbi:MAG: hypothetical protein JWM86_2038 [Thermoleophilia bacterium]|nr:hypothetical protein [Thermoleophilia bacterium]